MINDGKPITVADMKPVRKGTDAATDAMIGATEDFTNMIMEVAEPFRVIDRPMTDGMIMTALALAAGLIQGELEAHGVVPELTDEAITKLLVDNFKTGRKEALHVHKDCAEAIRAAKVAQAANERAANGGSTH